ncbi:MAG: hypothetical protein HQL94_01705 [Magnetococcales bacterium]|nr:hypothetical protein [Magnetococcales bacterium]MBF0438655.1 hypothetical protein [Magnetococcales bacterium]
MLMGFGDREKKQLLALWRELQPQEQKSVLQFAQFLASRQEKEGCEPLPPTIPDTPLPIPRPEVESAVAGLKRLKKSYPMIEADEQVLGEASRILMGKVMGASDAEVITQLETFFADRYQAWKARRS